MTKEELATERNEVREILEGFSEELSQANLNELSRVFCLINGDEKRIADLEKENAELKADNDARKFAMAMSEKVEKQLREENADLKEEVNKIAFARGNLEEENAELKERADKADLDSVLFFNQLCKAKEIIQALLNNFAYPIGREDWTVEDKEIVDKAEQFLSEVEE